MIREIISHTDPGWMFPAIVGIVSGMMGLASTCGCATFTGADATSLAVRLADEVCKDPPPKTEKTCEAYMAARTEPLEGGSETDGE